VLAMFALFALAAGLLSWVRPHGQGDRAGRGEGPAP
jgi:hypothetical protein